jgi:glycosyltransferase involved in cell wall biosynthesis
VEPDLQDVAESQITVVRSGLQLPVPRPGELVVTDGDVRAWTLDGRLLRRVRRYDAACLVTERLSTSGRPMLLWPLKLMARRCSVVDTEGHEREITTRLLLRWTLQLAREALGKGALLRRIGRDVDLMAKTMGRLPVPQRHGVPVYLRTDMSFGVRAGGSVGHIAGVLNELARRVGPPVLLTTAAVPTVGSETEVHVVGVPEAFWNFRELPSLALNDVCHREAMRVIGGRPVSLVYQRYSLNNYAGLRLARQLGVPLVIEYNGSEIWMSRHWGHPLKYEGLSSKIELLDMNGADLVVVVSRPMRDELVERGVSADRILVNPNGVDPDRYSPAIDGSAVRARHGFEGKIVIGFISTFQPWHGAEVLARAFVNLMRGHAALRDSLRLMMIGTGAGMAAVRQIITSAGLEAETCFTGLVPQEEGPQFLAAADILASPHVPNPDGTPFFGSPTKLFEYMAMGKPIVASNLDQIGEVLRHGETAWMVTPGDAEALADGLARLVSDQALRSALGEAARREAVARHTWRAHVGRILEALEARVRARVA